MVENSAMFFKIAFVLLFVDCAVRALNIEITDSVVRTIDLGSEDDGVEFIYKDFEKENQPPFRSTHQFDSSEEMPPIDENDDFDSWSIIWYIASFGGLVAFFLVVSCSEWCCRKHVREQQSRIAASTSRSPTPVSETPPPSYDQFAPPSYESLNYPRSNSEKSEFDVYVVSAQAFEPEGNGAGENPPSYATVNINLDSQERRQSEA